MRPGGSAPAASLEESIKEEARRLGFALAGITTPDPPPHLPVYEDWLSRGRHASMAYLARRESVLRRSDPTLILPDCRAIVALAIPYSKPDEAQAPGAGDEKAAVRGRVAAYAWGEDYHRVLRSKLAAIVAFIELQIGRAVKHRYYTDTGPVLEREFAQRAGLGWIGKNTCLINPRMGSYLLLAEILLDVELEPDPPMRSDHCGSCTRCIEACPTGCILPDRTLDAGRCISYLTIELREAIPSQLRPALGGWIFGCDVCQMVCPWNRFAPADGDTAFAGMADRARPVLEEELQLSAEDFDKKYRHSPLRRPKQEGYLRNVAVALGNWAGAEALPALEVASADADEMVAEHASWAIQQIRTRVHARA